MAGLEERRPTTGAFRREPPQDFLRGQMREWLEQVQENGRTRDLFELEMWLRSFERFFRVKNQPLSEKETRIPASDFGATVTLKVDVPPSALPSRAVPA